MLHDPRIIQKALPGCQAFDQISPSDFAATLHIQQGPLQGEYQGKIQLLDQQPNVWFSLSVNGTGFTGTISGKGRLQLAEKDGATVVEYAGNVDFLGPMSEHSHRILQTTANSLIRQFFEGIDREVQIQTGIHTTSLPDRPTLHRSTGTVKMQDTIAELKRDRQTVGIVLGLVAFTFFTFTGVLVILLLLIRWAKRAFNQQVARIVQEQEENRKSLAAK
jgi:hypothetical protein